MPAPLSLSRPALPVRARARRLLELHSLRAADALHLGAALVAAEEDPGRMGFTTLDGHLAEAAEKEGFRVYCS